MRREACHVTLRAAIGDLIFDRRVQQIEEQPIELISLRHRIQIDACAAQLRMLERTGAGEPPECRLFG